ncbi:hypothetical protein SPRG_09662 [Saprolegnia parasitica CBS 223.65]|uniref:Uncharacterized protein n=1 Tax=Saprolegnia parasitica (strain CBS 223.65) TaxID=695850 RepID=A0A067C232_SAPPC|nr:hypothetical protein SPRG_09662 [Saprolegnia parasitica CBS 223.65]KDO24829.1 hypothetical protein SPRG_09662 [Saprolegnia parasitica CBS 223.65]|eukprot:XP_012204477.1 hypothetical protein SPRG_09662 [Saprolegnia parasitica CBS 223.65]
MATPADGIWGHDANASSDSDDGVAFRTLELEDDEDGDEEYAPSEASDADADDDDDDDDDEVDDAMVDETLWADEADRANWEKEFERKNAKWKRQYGSRIDSEAQPLPSARLDAELRRNPWRRLGFFLGVLICAVQGSIIYQVHSEGATLTEAWTRLEDLGATVVLPSLYSALHDAIAVDEYGVDRAVPSDDSSNITTQDKADPDDASVTSDTDEPDASEVEPPTPVDTTPEEEPSTQVGESHDALDATTTAADTDDSVSQEAAEHETTVIEDVVEVAITFDGDAALSADDDDDNSSLPADANTLLDEAATLDTLASLDATQDEPARYAGFS